MLSPGAVALVGQGGMPLNHHGPPVNSSEYPNYLSLDNVTTLVKILLQIVTVLFGHTDSCAGSPWNFRRVYIRVHWRKSGQSYHRPPVKVSIFSISEKKSLESGEYLNFPELN